MDLRPALDAATALPADLFLGVAHGVRFAHDPHREDAFQLLTDDEGWWLDRAGQPPAAALSSLPPDLRAPRIRVLEQLLADGWLRSPALDPRPPRRPAERVFNTWIHITNHCNLACGYCYIDKTREHMTEPVFARILGAIETTARRREVDRVHLRFAGGEPLLRLPEVMALYAEAGTRVAPFGVRRTGAIITNGTRIDDRALAFIADEQLSVSVSIDGPPEVQDTLRPTLGGGPSSRLLAAGLGRLKGAGVRPYALVTVSAANLAELPDLAGWLFDEGMGFRLSLVRDFAGGTAELGEGEWRARVLAALERTYGVLRRRILARRAAGLPVEPSFRETHRFCDLELARPVKKACGAAETYVAIGADGTYTPCQGALARPHRDVVDPSRSLPELARGQTHLPGFGPRVANSTCASCRFRASCGGGCPLLLWRRDGHIDGRSPYCEIFQAVIPTLLELSALERFSPEQAQRALV